MNGFELIRKLRKKIPKLKSALSPHLKFYRAMIEEYASIKKEIGCFIKKPVTVSDLVRRIKKEMELNR